MATKTLSQVLRGVTTFGRLTVVREAPPKVSPSGYSARCAEVRCSCGIEKVVRAGDLRNGYATSCGCLQRELAAECCRQTHTVHGMATHDKVAAEYVIWTGMKQRCYNPNADSYGDYGARGITVCQQWINSFETFFADVGPRPSSAHSIDRIDNARGYEPGNVVWATGSTQARNRRSNLVIEWRGRSMTCAEAAEASGIDYYTLNARLKAGWTVDRAMSEPVRPMRPRLT